MNTRSAPKTRAWPNRVTAEKFPSFPTRSIRPFFQPSSAQNSTGLHLLTAGRLVGWKGLRILADAVAEIDGIHWHVAGDGPELPWLKSHASEKKYGDRVTWHGVLEPAALAGLMQTCHFFAQPSIGFDACPTAVLQAMSSGLVVAMSDKVGLHESFTSNRDFLLVPGGREAWIGGLEKLKALTPEERRNLGSAAREAVIQSFSWSGICTQIEALL